MPGSSAGRDVLLEIDWQGARQVRARIPDAVSVFILPPSRAALEQRMRKRGQDSEAVIAQRLAAAREEMSHYGEFDYVIVADCDAQTFPVTPSSRSLIPIWLGS